MKIWSHARRTKAAQHPTIEWKEQEIAIVPGFNGITWNILQIEKTKLLKQFTNLYSIELNEEQSAGNRNIARYGAGPYLKF